MIPPFSSDTPLTAARWSEALGWINAQPLSARAEALGWARELLDGAKQSTSGSLAGLPRGLWRAVRSYTFEYEHPYDADEEEDTFQHGDSPRDSLQDEDTLEMMGCAPEPARGLGLLTLLPDGRYRHDQLSAHEPPPQRAGATVSTRHWQLMGDDILPEHKLSSGFLRALRPLPEATRGHALLLDWSCVDRDRAKHIEVVDEVLWGDNAELLRVSSSRVNGHWVTQNVTAYAWFAPFVEETP